MDDGQFKAIHPVGVKTFEYKPVSVWTSFHGSPSHSDPGISLSV